MIVKTKLPDTGTLWREKGKDAVYRFARGVWSLRLDWRKQFQPVNRSDQNLLTLHYLTGQLEEVK